MTSAWTRERPTEPGWYWCRSPRFTAMAVEVVRDGDRLGIRMHTMPPWPLADTSDANEWARAEPPP